jgi:hypothetical protein
MNKYDDLMDQVGVHIYQFNFEVVEQAVEEIAAWDPKSPLKK